MFAFILDCSQTERQMSLVMHVSHATFIIAEILSLLLQMVARTLHKENCFSCVAIPTERPSLVGEVSANFCG
jgi:ABC-type uncharacterized transport system permease subunit